MSGCQMPEKEGYKNSASDIQEELDVSSNTGLSEDKVKRRREEYGSNRIETEEAPSWLSFFWDHLTEFVSILLIVVALIALATYIFLEPSIERLAESMIILGIVIINATVGAHQEYRSEQTAKKLQEMMKAEAMVIRDGEHQKIDAQELVPGDLVELKTGDKVPADLRIIEIEDLETQEAILTGESAPVTKGTEAIKEDRPLAERKNMAYTNTHVTRGKGRGLVVATGSNTEAGKIAEATKEGVKEEVPFVTEVQTTAKKISYLALSLVVIASLVFGFYGKDIYQIFLLAAALIIGAIPAALPVTVTYSLTNAMKKMAGQNVLVKNLPLLETLGGVDVICIDKTGTLTENRMAVKKFFIPQDDPVVSADDLDTDKQNELSRCALLANEAEEAKVKGGYVGDPEDIG